MTATFQNLLVFLLPIILAGCAGFGPQGVHKSAEQDPDALTVPKRWILQSFTIEGETRAASGQGIWIAFRKGGGYTSFDGVNSSFASPDPRPGRSAYTATPDGKIHLRANPVVTAVQVNDPDLREEISRRKKLLHQASTFVCTGDRLVLSDGSEDNQLRYVAQMPSSP